MDKLDMIKAFASLEGVELCSELNAIGSIETACAPYMSYEVLDDFALIFKAMLKYKVRMQGHKVYIGSMRNKSTVVNEWIGDPKSVAYAIIECILKHNNLWSN